MIQLSHRSATRLALALACAMSLAGPARATEPAPSGPQGLQESTTPLDAAPKETTWQSIAPDIFPDAAIGPADGIVTLVAPGRAEDAALVPLTMKLALPAGDPRTLKSVTLVIDENPAPMAGRFTFGAGVKDFSLTVRARVNSYSYVRAVAETSDGKLHMAKAFVKAAGGCSAPATKDTADSIAHLGDMRFRSFAATGRAEAQVQIRHPNFSGLQMDPITRGYTPAWFVREVAITQGGRPLLAMEGGISISEDPTFRFTYHPSAEPVTIWAEDTEGKVFTHTFPGGGS